MAKLVAAFFLLWIGVQQMEASNQSESLAEKKALVSKLLNDAKGSLYGGQRKKMTFESIQIAEKLFAQAFSEFKNIASDTYDADTVAAIGVSINGVFGSVREMSKLVTTVEQSDADFREMVTIIHNLIGVINEHIFDGTIVKLAEGLMNIAIPILDAEEQPEFTSRMWHFRIITAKKVLEAIKSVLKKIDTGKGDVAAPIVMVINDIFMVSNCHKESLPIILGIFGPLVRAIRDVILGDPEDIFASNILGVIITILIVDENATWKFDSALIVAARDLIAIFHDLIGADAVKDILSNTIRTLTLSVRSQRILLNRCGEAAEAMKNHICDHDNKKLGNFFVSAALKLLNLQNNAIIAKSQIQACLKFLEAAQSYVHMLDPSDNFDTDKLEKIETMLTDLTCDLNTVIQRPWPRAHIELHSIRIEEDIKSRMIHHFDNIFAQLV